MKERPAVMWLPFERDSPQATVVVRTTQPPQAVLPSIRETMRGIDANLPMVDVIAMEEQIAKGLLRERMFATLCGGFGILALVLSVVGLYGVVTYSTSKRRGEIGLRLALGAMRHDVIRMVLREGLALPVLGILAAAPVVWLGAKYVEKELFRLKPLDPFSWALALSILITAAVAAVLIPASGLRIASGGNVATGVTRDKKSVHRETSTSLAWSYCRAANIAFLVLLTAAAFAADEPRLIRENLAANRDTRSCCRTRRNKK